MKTERLSGASAPRQPHEIEIIGSTDIDSLSKLSAKVARDRQQPVITILDKITIVALPEDNADAIAERWTIDNDLRA
jgi:hypothetical protein